MTTQVQSITTQVQDMKDNANREFGPHVNKNASTMASRLRDFSRMNFSVFFGSKFGEDPQDFLNEVYKILFSMGVTSIEKAELVVYQHKDVA